MTPVKAVVKWMGSSGPRLVSFEVLFAKPNTAFPAGDTFSSVAALPDATVDEMLLKNSGLKKERGGERHFTSNTPMQENSPVL